MQLTRKMALLQPPSPKQVRVRLSLRKGPCRSKIHDRSQELAGSISSKVKLSLWKGCIQDKWVQRKMP